MRRCYAAEKFVRKRNYRRANDPLLSLAIVVRPECGAVVVKITFYKCAFCGHVAAIYGPPVPVTCDECRKPMVPK